MSPMSAASKILRISQKNGLVTARDLGAAGIHSQALSRLVKEGKLERVGRGIYRGAASAATEHHGLVLASAAVRGGTVCLLSALSFHGVGTQVPYEVWIAINRLAARPGVAPVGLRVVRFSGPALTEGIEKHRLEGRPVRIYSLAKTLADCFKYRNKIGIDVAVEALRQALSEGKVSPAGIDRFSRICRVQRVMRPYLEALQG
jgi:predicted transcriptional regulator of viral defense system